MAIDDPSSTHQRSHTAAIILAGGSGSRMRGIVEDKTLALLNGLPVICHSVLAFLASGCIQRFTIVYRDETQRSKLQDALNTIDLKTIPINWVSGGNERQDSVYNALQSQPETCTYILIHDAARPLVSADSIKALHAAVIHDRAATLAHPVADTVKRIPSAGELTSTQLEDLDRSRLWAMETPQAFALDLILKAYKHVQTSGILVTDDTAALAAIGIGTTLVPNNTSNIKITSPEDLAYAAWRLNER